MATVPLIKSCYFGGGVMDQKEFSEYTKAQLREIEKHKWIESERAGCDLGSEAVFDWIRLNAVKFRVWWESTHSEKK